MADNPLIDVLKHAMQLHSSGRLGEAEAMYTQMLRNHPGEPFVTHLLGILKMQTGRVDAAVIDLEAALAGSTARADWYPAVVNTNVALGRVDRALAWQQKLVALLPEAPEHRVRLAVLLVSQRRYDEAIVETRKAIELGPADPSMCHNNLGVIYDRLRQYGDAAKQYRAAIALKPTFVIAHRNLGDALRQGGDLESAETSYRMAAALDPALADAHNGIGLTLYLRNRFAEAIPHFQRAMQLNPKDTNPCINLVLCYGRLGDHGQLESILRHVMRIDPDDAPAHSALIMLMNYTRGHRLPDLLKESREFDRRFAVALLPESAKVAGGASSPIERAAHRPEARVTTAVPVRLGFISPDFRHHPVAIFLEPLLRHLDRGKVTVVCYSNVQTPDDFTPRFKALADLWWDIARMSDQQAADQIREDRIDILIDLAGHTVDNRLLVLARKPAPVQATWLGYPNTTGVTAIDYRITDILADPVGAEKFYREKLVRLPDAFFVYQPPEQDEPVSPLPMLANGQVTFGSFNNVIKITPDIARVWSAILRATPGSKLLIAGIPPDAQARLLAAITGPDVAAGRIEFPQAIGFDKFLKLHHRVDIALDAFPYSGHTTTCNTLWMGVPTVSLAGPTAVSRCGMSIMGNLAMGDEWVATKEDDYSRLAVEWAKRADALSVLRAGLRGKLLESPLTDAARFARNWETAMEKIRRES